MTEVNARSPQQPDIDLSCRVTFGSSNRERTRLGNNEGNHRISSIVKN